MNKYFLLFPLLTNCLLQSEDECVPVQREQNVIESSGFKTILIGYEQTGPYDQWLKLEVPADIWLLRFWLQLPNNQNLYNPMIIATVNDGSGAVTVLHEYESMEEFEKLHPFDIDLNSLGPVQVYLYGSENSVGMQVTGIVGFKCK